MASLAGKVALITGGSKGIGAATALTFATLGATVIITYSSDEDAAQRLVQELNNSANATATAASSTPGSGPALAIKSDAGSVGAARLLISQVLATQHRLDILVLNAGVLPMCDLAHISESTFDHVMALNVKGPLFLAQAAAPHMASGSSIIFLSTSLTAASTVSAPYLLYLASKGAVEQMVRVLAKELGPRGVNVNAVAPGPTATELFLKGKSEELLEGIKGLIPRGRLGEPGDVAGVMAWLAGAQSGWVTGQVVRVNGGMV